MFTKLYRLKKYPNGAAVAIMPRPRGGDWLEDEIRQLKAAGIHTVVSLLESTEIYELQLENEKHLCTKYGLTYINFPIADRGIPKDLKQAKTLIEDLRHRINHGQSIIIHCRMGIGRSSIIAGAVMMTKNHSATETIDAISKIRGLKVPDTDEQITWLTQFQT